MPYLITDEVQELLQVMTCWSKRVDQLEKKVEVLSSDNIVLKEISENTDITEVNNEYRSHQPKIYPLTPMSLS